MPTQLDAQKQAYTLANPDVAVNPDAAIYKHWLDLKAAGTLIGVPIGSEIHDDDGVHVYQSFTSGAVLVWDGQAVTLQ
jgi:uncharacterized protein with LGFP repeats